MEWLIQIPKLIFRRGAHIRMGCDITYSFQTIIKQSAERKSTFKNEKTWRQTIVYTSYIKLTNRSIITFDI